MRKNRRSNHNSQRPTSRRAPSRDEQIEEYRSFYALSDNCRFYLDALLLDGYNQFTFTRSADSHHRDSLELNKRISDGGIGFVAIVLPKLFQCLLNYLEYGVSSYPGWKTKPGTEHPAFLQQFFSRIYDAKTCETDKVKYIEWLYQFCVSFKKLKGPYRNGVLRKQLADFVQTDIDLRYIEFTSGPLGTISELARREVDVLIRNIDVNTQPLYIPKPGPGATNTKVEKHLRFRPHVLYTQLNDEFPYEEWFYSHPWDLVTESHRHPYKLPKAEMPTSRFKFVPKTYGKPRGICIEELETQFLQQAVKRGLYATIEKHPLTKGKVNFASQSVNGDLALRSSLTKELATLDMSEASDRVSRDLVMYLFEGNPDFCNKLEALSTKSIELPDQINFIKDFPSAKFAPMGSALCFPIMAVVHFVLIRAIASFVGLRQHLDSVYVYGDDILCHHELVPAVYEWLPRFGMKLNEQKSFYKSYFRESCGVHAYHGVEITPVYFKSTPNTDMSLNDFVGLLRTEYQLHKKGLNATAAHLRSELRRLNKWFKTLPYVGLKSRIPGFIRDNVILNRDNIVYYSKRWDSETQCDEFKIKVITPFEEQLPPITQNEGLLRWHTTSALLERKHSLEVPDEWVAGHVKGSLLRLKTKVVWLRESSFNGCECFTQVKG